MNQIAKRIERIRRLREAERLLLRCQMILPRIGEPVKVLTPAADPAVFDQLSREIEAFLKEAG